MKKKEILIIFVLALLGTWLGIIKIEIGGRHVLLGSGWPFICVFPDSYLKIFPLILNLLFWFLSIFAFWRGISWLKRKTDIKLAFKIPPAKLLMEAGVFLIIISFLGAWLSTRENYSSYSNVNFSLIIPYSLVVVVAAILGMLLKFKNGIYWFVLPLTIFSSYVLLALYGLGFWAVVLTGGGLWVWTLPMLGHIFVLLGLILYQVNNIKNRIKIKSPWKYLVLTGVGLLISLIGYAIMAVGFRLAVWLFKL